MQKNLPDDEEDTAFGRLGPRAGPGAVPKPSRRPRRWGWWVAAIVAVLLVGLYASGRL